MDNQFTQYYEIICTQCGEPHRVQDTQSFCKFCGHGAPLTIKYDVLSPFLQLPKFLEGIDSCPESSLVSLSTLSAIYQCQVMAKCELELPTGSFKHRGSLAEVQAAINLGYKTIVCASTGNMGVSLAALCARKKVRLTLFVPKETPLPKLAVAQKYGAKVKYVTGSYSVCEKQAAKYAAEKQAFLAGDYYVRAEGAKLVAREIVDQLNGQIPDMIIVPAGVGTNASAIMKGFVEQASGGMIPTVPQLCIVQSEQCCPIVDSLELGVKITTSSTNTLCSATAVADPYDYAKVKHYMDLTQGMGVRVADSEALMAARSLAATEGIDCELSAAMSIAALGHLRGKIQNKIVVLVLTGAGYKDLPIQEEAYHKLVETK